MVIICNKIIKPKIIIPEGIKIDNSIICMSNLLIKYIEIDRLYLEIINNIILMLKVQEELWMVI